jgi:hypothetical protein
VFVPGKPFQSDEMLVYKAGKAYQGQINYSVASQMQGFFTRVKRSARDKRSSLLDPFFS